MYSVYGIQHTVTRSVGGSATHACVTSQSVACGLRYLPQGECQHQLTLANWQDSPADSNIVQFDTFYLFKFIDFFRELDETKELLTVDVGRSLATIVATDHTFREKITKC